MLSEMTTKTSRFAKAMTAAVATVSMLLTGFAGAVPAQAATIVTVPGAPATPTSTLPGAGQIQVNWAAPTNLGGSPITGYTLMSSTSSTFAAGPTTITSTETGTSKTFSNLVAGTSYYYKVAAKNAKGQGLFSAAKKVVAPTVTSAPSAVKATRGIRTTTVSWTAPLTTTTLPVTGYTVQYSTDKTFATGVTTLTSSATSLVIADLPNATSYSYRVRATNAVGDSAWSSIVAAATFALPNAPSVPKAVAGNAAVTVTWTKPTSDVAITGYRVQYANDKNFTSNVQTVDTAALTATFSSLAAGTAYYVRVAAISPVGTSAYSTASSATTYTVPGTPTTVVLTRGVGSIKVGFRAPATNGGTTITGYTVEYADNADFTGSQTVSLSTGVVSTTLTGLASGTAYYIRITASNAVGTSAATATLSARTYAAPAAVTAGTLVASRTAGALTASWTNPSATLLDTLAITSSNIEVATDADFTDVVKTVTLTGATATSSVSGLENGVKYYFRVRITTNAGTSAWSAALANATTLAVPYQPTNVALEPNATSIRVTWSAPTTGATPTGYRIMYSKSANFATSPAVVDAKTATTFNLTGLTTNTTYYVKVLAYNAIGAGTYTAAVSAFTASTPSAPLNVAGQAVASMKDMTFSWAQPTVGAPITSYRVQYSTDSTFATGVQTLDLSTTSATVTAPAYGQTYYVKVAASNAYGFGAYSAPVTVAGPALPAAGLLASLSTSVSGRAMTVNYEYSAGDANAAVYALEYSKNADFSDAVSYNLTSNPSSTDVVTQVQVTGYRTFSNLSNGTYYVRMVVSNSLGDSRVQTVTTTGLVDAPVGAPGIPAVPTITPTGAGELTMTWPAVDGNGDDNIIYTIQYSKDYTFETGVTTVQTTTASYVATGLDSETTYYARVKAVNGYGDSGYSATDIQNQSATFIGDQSTFDWWKPNYVYYFNIAEGQMSYIFGGSNQGSQDVNFAERGISVAHIVLDGTKSNGNTVHYEGTLTAVPGEPTRAIFTDTTGNGAPNWNGIYWGMPQFTITMDWVTADYKGKTWGLPSAVSSWQVTHPSATSLTAYWNAPSRDGGSPVTGYNVEWSTDSTFSSGVQSATSTSTNYTAENLTPGARYYFRVSAQTGAGEGPKYVINQNGHIAAEAPSAAANATLTSDVDGLYVTFTAPQSWNYADAAGNGLWNIEMTHSTDPEGSPYNGYMGSLQVYMDSVPAPGETVTVAIPQSAYSWMITNNNTYAVRVAAQFAEFTGGSSNWTNVVTFQGADGMSPSMWAGVDPTTTPVGNTGKSAVVYAYHNDRGLGFTGFRVEYSKSSAFPAGSTTVVDYADTDQGHYTVVSGLEAKTKYYFRLRGLYDGGTGAASSTYAITTYDLDAPTAPALTTNVGNNEGTTYDLSWTASQQQGDGTAFDHYVVSVTAWNSDLGIYAPAGTVVYSDNKATTAQVTGLVIGKDYYVEVRAYSVTGQYSTGTRNFAARAPYAAPGDLTLSVPTNSGGMAPMGPQDGVSATWTTPESDHGLIYGFKYQVATDAAFTNLISNGEYNTYNPNAGSSNSGAFSWQNGVQYAGQTVYVRVAAYNWSDANEVGLWATGTYTVPMTPPTTPGNIAGVVADDLTVSLTWNASSQQAGGDAIDHYEVTVRDNSGTMCMGPCNTTDYGTVVYPTDRLQTGATVTGLTAGSFYYASVYAVSISGAKSFVGWSMSGGYMGMGGTVGQIGFYVIPSVAAPAVTAQVGVDSMMGGANLKWIGVTSTRPSDSYGRMDSMATPYFEVATDAAFSNVIASQSSMGGSMSSTTLTFRGVTNSMGMMVSEFETGSTYYVRVRYSYNSMSYGQGYTRWSDPIAYRIPTTPPTSPTNVAAATAEDLTTTLTWNASSQQPGGEPVDHYEVVVTKYDSMCSMMNTCDKTPQGTVTYPSDRTQTGATVTGLTSGQAYEAKIYAVSTSGSKSIPSSGGMMGQPSTGTVSFTALPSVAAPYVFAEVGNDMMSGGTNLKYISVTGTKPSDSYGRLDNGWSNQMFFEVASDSNFANVLARSTQMGSGSSYMTTFRGAMDQWGMSVVSEFVTGETYYVRARMSYSSMQYGSGYTLWTAPIAYRIPTTPPTAPANVSAVVAEDLSVALTWDASSQQAGGDPVDHYEVVVTDYSSSCSMGMGGADCTTPRGTVVYPTDRLQTSVTVTGLTTGALYKAKVYAVSTSGSKSIIGYDNMTMREKGSVSFYVVPSLAAPALDVAMGTDSMMSDPLKTIGVTANMPSDPIYNRLSGGMGSPQAYFEVATDSAFTNVVARKSASSMMSGSPVSTTFSGPTDYMGMSNGSFETGVTYYVRARIGYYSMQYSSGYSLWTAPVAYKIPTTPPTSPTGISAAVAEDATVTLTWSASSQQAGGDPVDHYEVVIKDNSGSMCMGPCNTTEYGTVVYPTDRTQTGATVTGLNSGSYYYATIVAVSTSGSKSISVFDNMTMQYSGKIGFYTVPTLGAPALDVTVGNISGGGDPLKQMMVTATMPSDPTYNRLSGGMGSPQAYFEVATDSAFTNVIARKSGSSMMGSSPVSIEIEGPTDYMGMTNGLFETGTTYYVRARVSYNSMSYGSGYSLWTAPVAYTIPTTPPTSPTGVTASVADDLTVTVNWNASTQQEGGDPVDHYEVLVTAYDSMCAMMGSCSNTPQGTVVYPTDRLQTGATITGLTGGSTYSVTVYAVSTSGSKSIPGYDNMTMQQTGKTTVTVMGQAPAPTVTVAGTTTSDGVLHTEYLQATATKTEDPYNRLSGGNGMNWYYEVATDQGFTNVVRNVSIYTSDASATYMFTAESNGSDLTPGQYFVRARIQYSPMSDPSAYTRWSTPVEYTVLAPVVPASVNLSQYTYSSYGFGMLVEAGHWFDGGNLQVSASWTADKPVLAINQSGMYSFVSLADAVSTFEKYASGGKGGIPYVVNQDNSVTSYNGNMDYYFTGYYYLSDPTAGIVAVSPISFAPPAPTASVSLSGKTFNPNIDVISVYDWYAPGTTSATWSEATPVLVYGYGETNHYAFTSVDDAKATMYYRTAVWNNGIPYQVNADGSVFSYNGNLSSYLTFTWYAADPTTSVTTVNSLWESTSVLMISNSGMPLTVVSSSWSIDTPVMVLESGGRIWYITLADAQAALFYNNADFGMLAPAYTSPDGSTVMYASSGSDMLFRLYSGVPSSGAGAYGPIV
jgi:hypothetical protein